MAWKDFGSSLALTRRRRVLATAIMYGLTLTVRFTSATSEDTDVPAQAVQGADAMTSVMISDAAQALYRDWLPGTALPIGLQRGSLLSAKACRAACMPGARTPFLPSCAAEQ